MGENIKEVRLAASSLYTHSIISLFVAEMSRLIEVTLLCQLILAPSLPADGWIEREGYQRPDKKWLFTRGW